MAGLRVNLHLATVIAFPPGTNLLKGTWPCTLSHYPWTMVVRSTYYGLWSMEYGVCVVWSSDDRMPGHLATLITVFDMPSSIINSIFFSFYLYLSVYSASSSTAILFEFQFEFAFEFAFVYGSFLIAGAKREERSGRHFNWNSTEMAWMNAATVTTTPHLLLSSVSGLRWKSVESLDLVWSHYATAEGIMRHHLAPA